MPSSTCKAVTKTGQPCKLAPKGDSGFCWRHSKDSEGEPEAENTTEAADTLATDVAKTAEAGTTEVANEAEEEKKTEAEATTEAATATTTAEDDSKTTIADNNNSNAFKFDFSSMEVPREPARAPASSQDGVPSFKLVIAGDGAVGKSAFVERWISGGFLAQYEPTLGTRRNEILLNTNLGPVKLDIWDLAGQEQYGGLRDGYYIGAQAALLCFDVTNRTSYKANEGWWYEGGGIYRHVRVIVVNPLHTKQYGIYIPSSVIGPIVNLTADAMVDVYTELENVGPDNEFIVQSIIFDPKGAEVSRTESPLSFLPTGKSTTVYQNAYLTKAALWDITSPSLYVLQTLVHDDDGTILDERKTTFGIRKAVYDAQDGFSLNDVPIKVKGMCNHQDFAGIGTAIPESIQEFRVRRLQDLGVNAWRMSHNPPNPELLDLTDSLGMMVWDENRFLGNFSTWVADLATMVLRDRNHPSIMWWSLCNEWGCEQLSNDITVRTGIMFREVLKRLDLTRPISGAWTGDMTTGYKWATTVTDIMGINYNYGAFPTFHQAYPTIPLISSESCSCTSDRSYLIDANQSLIGAYHAWSCIRDCWAPIATNKYIQGSFDWTGFDYRGEETPTPWPAINSHFGILDLAGFMKDDAFYYQAQYRPEPLAHITPSYWNKEDGMTNATTAAISQCVDPAPAPGTELPPSFQNFKYTFDGSGKAGSTIESLYKPGMCVTFNGFNQYPSPFVECNAADTNQLLFWDPSLHHFYVVDAKTQTKYCLDANGDGSGNVGFWTCSDPQHANQNFVWDAAKSRFALNDPDFPGTCLSFVDHSVAQVWVYTNGDSVELFLNGTSLGIMNVSQFEKATYFVHYSPGNLTAVASKSGVRWASDEVLTAGPPSFLELEVERHFSGTLKADGVDALLLTLSVKDANGVLVRHEAPEISFKIDGPGALIGLGNGNPSDHEDDKGTSRQTFSGLLRAVIQSGTKPGPIVVTASADCCSPATITLQSQ